MHHRLIFLLSFLLLLGFLPSNVFAQEEEPAIESEPVPASLASPRATLKTFLENMHAFKSKQRADISATVEALDLSAFNPVVRDEEGQDRAWMLLAVLDQLNLSPAVVSANPDAVSPVKISIPLGSPLELVRQADKRWLFSSVTVKQLPQLFDELSKGKPKETQIESGLLEPSQVPLHIRLRSNLSEKWRQKIFLFENWQWVAGLIFLFLGLLADKITSVVLKGIVIFWNNSRFWCNFEPLATDMLRPFGLMAMAGIWWYGVNNLGLSPDQRLVLLVAVTFIASVSAVWGAYRLVDFLSAYLSHRASRSANKLDDALVPLFRQALKVLVTLIGLIFIASNLGINVTGLIAGLGLGGLAFALAAKDMVQNIFGSITVISDGTFMVGDWIKVGDVQGTVENIGFRSTRIRTFHNSVLTVPNSQFITANVDNLGKRQYRRYKTTLGITYDTPPEKIPEFCEGMRKLVENHPKMRNEGYYVHLNSFSESSIDILVYVFFQVRDWAEELQAREEFILQTIELAASLGVEFAFPTRTVYLNNSG